MIDTEEKVISNQNKLLHGHFLKMFTTTFRKTRELKTDELVQKIWWDDMIQHCGELAHALELPSDIADTETNGVIIESIHSDFLLPPPAPENINITCCLHDDTTAILFWFAFPIVFWFAFPIGAVGPCALLEFLLAFLLLLSKSTRDFVHLRGEGEGGEDTLEQEQNDSSNIQT